ncbi:hypothetical protein, partial [Chryseobacterium sp. SIMBA_038]|uniref:hypothetical protein n=1 Tax=Chryseobacterium sp. SIMBA_038 TaxID=3085780 RepID=UPI00397913D1
IKNFLFMASLYCLEKISIKLSHYSKVANSWITDFKQSNKLYLLDVNDSDMAYYLKKDMFYCLSKGRSYLITYKLYTGFCEELKDKRMSL